MLTSIRYAVLLASAPALFAQARFDMAVRNDFFAGFAGNLAALEHGMKACADVLAENPKHAEAMVWHGTGTFFLSGEAAKSGDYPKSAELYRKGLEEMAAAVALSPDNPAVLIPRGAALLTGSQRPRQQASILLRSRKPLQLFRPVQYHTNLSCWRVLIAFLNHEKSLAVGRNVIIG